MRVKGILNGISENFSPGFLKAGMGAAPMLVCLILSGNIYAQTVPKYTLFIEKGVFTVNGGGGATIDVWGYTTVSGGAPMIPGPKLEAAEGESLTVRVINHHNQAHNFVINDVTTDTSSIAAGATKDYTFTASKAGVFLYVDTLNNQINQEMGLHGSFTVRPANTLTAWTGGPSFNKERTWVLAEMDKPYWNDLANLGSVDTTKYRPNYFLINGQGGFDGMHDPNSTLDGLINETFLVRIVNAGQFSQALHFHRNHFQVISVNGVNDPNPESVDTVSLKGGETMMILYQLRSGTFPMHNHTAQMETANGVYLNGTATMIIGN